MRITIFGSGYVGLVTGTCLAEVGNSVMCVDVNAAKIAQLQQGKTPIYEPGLEELLNKNLAAGRLQFTTDMQLAVDFGEIQCIAVGTPPDEDGSADLQYVISVAQTIGQYATEYKLIMDKSTVPVGTAEKVRQAVQAELNARGVSCEFDVVSNPEFLKEGAAIDDFMRPDRIIVGTDNARPSELMRELYAPFNRNHDKLIVMDIHSAELTKYAANAMLATKISFMNEMAALAERVGADIEQVRIGIGSDPRIGFDFIYPGCGYGGSCFPKDVQALERTANQVGLQARILQAVEAVNYQQRHLLFDKIYQHFRQDIRGKCFAMWGLAFKPNTDDMREAPSRVILEALWAQGARVQVYDPQAMAEATRLYGKRDDLILCDTPEAAVKNADALIIVTEWRLFCSPDFPYLKSQLKQPLIFDGRNLYEPRKLQKLGFTYYAIGRGERLPA
ncbi:MAG: UDP-glucose/GDP-mannose dehydrogenase family protein [Thiotrichaceae bacterium]|nr:UDP-glucose/GDP-mannose dehydrogenase family protein [Thiotrichaceae bacterium]